jgi:hypothetical protein
VCVREYDTQEYIYSINITFAHRSGGTNRLADRPAVRALVDLAVVDRFARQRTAAVVDENGVDAALGAARLARVPARADAGDDTVADRNHFDRAFRVDVDADVAPTVVAIVAKVDADLLQRCQRHWKVQATTVGVGAALSDGRRRRLHTVGKTTYRHNNNNNNNNNVRRAHNTERWCP